MAKEEKKPETPSEEAEQPVEGIEVNEAELPQAEENIVPTGTGKIDVLLDTTMSVSASLGEVELKVRELLQLGAGSVLKLDKQVGEPVDLLLRGIPFATGTLVVVGDQLGIRIKEILSPADKIAE